MDNFSKKALMLWRRLRRLRRFIFLGLFLVITISVAILEFVASDRYHNTPPPLRNYFAPADEHQTLIIDTVSCHIPNISEYHSSVLPLVTNSSSRLDCTKDENRKWTYVDGIKQVLVLNKTAIHSSGYSVPSISCCYRSILRLNQTEEAYDLDADSLIEISSECKPLTGVETPLSPPQDEFIRVVCTSKYWPFLSDTVYRYFHATPLAKNDTIVKKHARLLESSHDASTLPQPPSVILFGIDSMSRLSFHRNMPKTMDALRSIGAVEFFGYTKINENTYPNAVAFMTGSPMTSHNEHEKCDWMNSNQALDACPFIWKDFERAGYLTAFLEDAPYLATYNYNKVGFLRPPVDYYLRPFMLGVSKLVPRKSYYYLECLGRETVDEVVHQYLENIAAVGKQNKLPTFIYAWLTNLAHGDLNGARSGDDVYQNFIQRLDLHNSILFFISDHGYRYGPIRQTFSGWYEDKLPNFWVYLPPWIRERHPDWKNALETNARRLTSPLDLHATLVHILSTFSSRISNIQEHVVPSTSPIGHSLFLPISSDRNCPDAGIPNNYCACQIPKKLETDDPRLVLAALAALRTLNGKLPSNKCAPLFLSSIQAGGLVESESSSKNNSTIIVAFYTIPGGFLFEANVLLDQMVTVGELLRMNKISRDVSCVRGHLENYCYCDPS